MAPASRCPTNPRSQSVTVDVTGDKQAKLVDFVRNLHRFSGSLGAQRIRSRRRGR